MPEITVIEHLLATQMRWSPKASGQFTSLLHDLVLSAKLISREVSKAGLVDILGGTGEMNVHGEKVQKLDEFANNIMLYRMRASGAVCALGSEELEEAIILPEESAGSYILYFDPLDGSSNIDANISIGTIFSLFRRKDDATGPLPPERLLRRGVEQVAAGYFLYGPSTMLVYSTGHGVNGFTLDPSVGEFLLSHPDMQIPQKGSIYSVNSSNHVFWDKATKEAVEHFAAPSDGSLPYSLRYVGSLVADFHRTLLYGGIFMYPGDTRKPEGKLRLLYEASPMAFLAEQANGKATNGRDRILEITPQALHQRTPLIIGSADDVDAVTAIYSKYA